MSKKESTPIKTTKITVRGTIIVAIIGLIGVLIPIFMVYIQKSANKETEYIGRVIDSNNQQPIAGAKVTLDLQGVPPIVYTDNQGVYLFKLAIDTEISGRVRVDASGYQTYNQIINISPDLKTIEDIRLSPTSISLNNVPSANLQLGVWSMDYFSNIQLNPPVVYHVDQSAEQNTEGGYTIQINSIDLHSNPQIPQSNFSVRLSGLFYFSGGTYEFHCEHHDGCRVYIDGQSWIEAWWDGGGGHDMARDIPAGNHTVSIEFYDKGGLGILQVSWRIKPETTPDSVILPTEPPVPTLIVEENCFQRDIWTPYEKDKNVSSDNGCWNLTNWGFTPQNSGMLIVPSYPSTEGQFHGIYTPIKNNIEIRFNIKVDKFLVEDGRTANIGIGIINLDPVGPATSRLIFYHYNPQQSKFYIPMQTGIDAKYKDGISTVLSISVPQKVVLKVNGPLLTAIFDDKTETQLTIPFDNRAFWISYSVPPNSQLIMSISDLEIK